MPKTEPPSDEVRELFRRELIRENGGFGLSILGHADEISRFRFYLDTLEKYISKEEAEEVESLKAQAATLPDASRGEFWAWYYPIHWDEIFRTNLRSSFLVSLISFIEIHLAQACRHVEVIARTPIDSTELRGSVLERANRFLTAFGNFKQPAPDHWTLLAQIYDVRNVFVHHAGYIASYSQENRVRQFCRTQPGLREQNGYICLGSEFCPFVLETTETLLGAIASELAALCARVRQFEGL